MRLLPTVPPRADFSERWWMPLWNGGIREVREFKEFREAREFKEVREVREIRNNFLSEGRRYVTYISTSTNFLSEGVRCGLDMKIARMGSSWRTSHSG